MKHLLHVSVLSILLPGLICADAQNVPPTTSPSLLEQIVRAQFNSAESKATPKAAYEPAAKALALLCQSDRFFFLDEPPLAPAWTPPEVLKLGPTWVNITPEEARVEFGGGFHHFGYELDLDKSAGNDKQNSWTLNFYSEDSPTKPLMTFMVNKADHVERAQFISGALAEFERRAGNSPVMERDVNERLVFLLKFDAVQMVRASIRDCAAANPKDWPDQLLTCVIAAKNDPTASAKLDTWAKKTGDFSAWPLAAYGHGPVGDEDSMDHCVKKALVHPVDDPDWIMSNARYRGATMCMQLLKARRDATCSILCDALLDYTDSDSYLAPQIISIRELARHTKRATSPPVFEEGVIFDPFKGIDLSRLAAGNPASTQSSSTSHDQLLEYYDHRIAADPGSHRNYTVKITYLLSQHRNSDALATCKAAAQALPDWWRPQMAMATMGDAETRKQAEQQFRKWVEGHPAFIHWWYLSRYYRDLGRDSDAVAALQSAAKYPLENVDDDETWVPAAFAFDAASYAYGQKKFDLVLDIARVWSTPRGAYNYFDDDIYAFRAAGELAQGRFATAKSNADKAVEAASKHAIWAGHLAELQQAANAKDQSFVYDPGSLCGDWSLFPAASDGN